METDATLQDGDGEEFEVVGGLNDENDDGVNDDNNSNGSNRSLNCFGSTCPYSARKEVVQRRFFLCRRRHPVGPNTSGALFGAINGQVPSSIRRWCRDKNSVPLGVAVAIAL